MSIVNFWAGSSNSAEGATELSSSNDSGVALETRDMRASAANVCKQEKVTVGLSSDNFVEEEKNRRENGSVVECEHEDEHHGEPLELSVSSSSDGASNEDQQLDQANPAAMFHSLQNDIQREISFMDDWIDNELVPMLDGQQQEARAHKIKVENSRQQLHLSLSSVELLRNNPKQPSNQLPFH